MKQAATSLKKIVVTLPSSNQQTELTVAPGSEFVFQFLQDAASYGRVDNSLIITAPAGGSVTLRDFFVGNAEDGLLPSLILQDGAVVSSADFLAAHNVDASIDTAAGAQKNQVSSGLNAYDADAGLLVSGIDRLGSLSQALWDPQSYEKNVTVSGLGLPKVTPQAGFNASYSSRAVVYMSGGNVPQLSFEVADPGIIRALNSTAGASFSLLNSNGDPIQGFIDLSSAVFNPATGLWTFDLDTAALLAAMPGDGSNLYEYVQITVGGKTYIMQVVFNYSGVFDSAAENANLDNGGFALDGNLINGEYHAGHTSQTNTDAISTSDLSDSVNLMNGLNGATLETNAGDDTVSIGGAAVNSTIDLGDGNNTLTTGALNGTTTVTAGSGADSITVNGSLGAAASIHTGAGDDSLTINGNKSGEITMGSGNDTLYITGDHSSPNATHMGDGENTLSIAGAVSGTGTIYLGDGKTDASIDGSVTGKIDGGTGEHTVMISDKVGSNAQLTLWDGDLTIMGGVHAYPASGATITGNNLDISIYGAQDGGRFSSGILTKSVSGSSLIPETVVSTKGDVTVLTQSEDKYLPGVGTHTSAASLDTRYNGKLSIDIDGTLTLETAASQHASSIFNLGTATTTIRAGAIESSTLSTSTFAHGIESDGAGSVSLTSDSYINFRVSASAGAYGIKANNASLTAKDGDLEIFAHGKEDGTYAIVNHLSSGLSSTIDLKAENGNVLLGASTDNGGAFVIAQSGSARVDYSVEASKNIELEASNHSSGSRTGIISIINGSLDMKAGEDVVMASTVKAGNATALGVSLTGTAELGVTAGGDINLETSSVNGNSLGVSLVDNATANLVAGGDVNIVSIATGTGNATAITVNNTNNYADAGLSISGGSISVEAKGTTGTAIAASDGSVTLEADRVTVIATNVDAGGIETVGDALWAGLSSAISIKASTVDIDGKVTSINNGAVSVELSGAVNNLHFTDNLYTSTGGTIAVKASGASDDTVTMKSIKTDPSGGIVLIDLGTGNDSLTIGGQVEALGGSGSSTVFLKSGGDVTIGSSLTSATAITAMLDASVDIKVGNSVSLTAQASGIDDAYGMYAFSDGTGAAHNMISALYDDHAITVTITAKAGTAGEAYAMWAEGVNAVNTIAGSGEADAIAIVGDIYADHNGKNSIDTGAGDDIITLHGKVHDTGNFGAGSLTLDAGSGFDTLVLVAENYAQFVEFYDSWLQSSFGTINVEAVQVNVEGLSPTDLASLQSYFNNSTFDNTSVSFTDTESGTMYIDHVFTDTDGILSMDDLLDMGNGAITQFDMRGIHADDLRISEAALDALRGLGQVAITGDGSDTVTLGQGWTTSGTTNVDSVVYGEYTNGDTTLLIQQEIIINMAG